jgi:hypothetical protein
VIEGRGGEGFEEGQEEWMLVERCLECGMEVTLVCDGKVEILMIIPASGMP